MTILLDTIMFCREFDRDIGARRHVDDGILHVYLRIGFKVGHPGCVFLHIPDVEVAEEHRNKGLFTAYLDALELIQPLHGIAVFGVGSTRLRGHLVRRNYLLYDINDYVKMW